MSEIPNRIARAQSDAAGALAARRRRFDLELSQVVSKFAKAGAYGGSPYRQTIHAACAAELRARIALIYEVAIRCVVAPASSWSDDLRSSAKDWIAREAATEASDIERFLWKPRPAFGESGEPDRLDDDLRREQVAIFARFDGDFDRLQKKGAERMVRVVVSVARRIWSAIAFWRS